MNPTIPGLHHITALASDPQRNAEFYTDVLGLRLVKRTVNFDSPGVYHLYYGDETGSPGTILTFFPFPNAAQGKRGSGDVHAVAFAVAPSAMDFWIHRLSMKGISFDGPSDRFGEPVITFLDPDGMKIELIARNESVASKPWKHDDIPAENALRGFAGVTMGYINDRFTRSFLRDVMGFTEHATAGKRTRFLAGQGAGTVSVDTIVLDGITPPRPSAGSVHHIAWSVPDDAAQLRWSDHLGTSGTYPTEVKDRQYFRSIYFREPGGVLFEIATDTPGFLIDEDHETLGTQLCLPPWFEEQRSQIERVLIPLDPSRTYAD